MLASRGLRDFGAGPEPERDATQRSLARHAAWNIVLEAAGVALLATAALAAVLAVA